MFRLMRVAVAAVVAVAIITLPLALDRCAESCDVHTLATVPECHHAASTGAHFAPAPQSCGHDHSGTAVLAAKNAASSERAFDATLAVPSPFTLAPHVSGIARVTPHSSPGPPSALAGGFLPLRV